MADNDDEESVQDPMSAFAEFLEMQRELEKTARNIVDSVRNLVDNPEKLVPADLRDFPGYDSEFYDGTAEELSGRGLRVLGDFADAGMVDKPVEQRAFYRFALSEAGGTTAWWFVVPPPPNMEPNRCLFLHTWFEGGGSFMTARGAGAGSVPQPSLVRSQDLKPGTATGKVVDAHAKAVAASGGIPRRLRTMDDVLAAREAESRMIAEFRKAEGVKLFEPMLRDMLGDGYDEQGQPLVEVILAHPGWWTGEKETSSTSSPPTDSPTIADPDAPPHLMFLASHEDDRGHLTTFGMMMLGLPELQMKELAANHWRAGRFLTATVAKKLRDHAALQKDREAFHSGLRNGITLTLGRKDVFPSQPMVAEGRYPEADSGVPDPVTVRLILEGFAEKTNDSDAELLTLLPPLGHRSDKDTWLRDSCRALGQDAPNPLPAASLDSEMQKASEKARATLGAVREQFRRGLPSDQTLAIKIGLTTLSGGREFVWIKVNEWEADGILTGTLETEPTQCPGFLLGQVMRVPESDVFDRAIGGEQGMVNPPLTDIVAQEFGVDL